MSATATRSAAGTVQGVRRLDTAPLTALALGACAAVLLTHAWHYAFLTDDAFISFRYARNLAEGAGLVFNPGQAPVEGYTNFLWVMLLALGAALGVAPETAAIPLSLLCTLGYFAVVVELAARYGPPERRGLAAVLAGLLLATAPSVAVWSTSGLETRLFELLVFAGVSRLLWEDRQLAQGTPARLPLAALCFALATLTRPDGLLLAASAMGVLALRRWRALRRFPAPAVGSVAVYTLLVGGHLLFRRAYYGDWLPNTWYAKVGGRVWWELGGQYLAAFSLEHALVLWLPLLALGVAFHLRRGTPALPLAFAVVCLPHALYVASIGGDHFEYRPLDLYLPFVFVLVAQGVAAAARGTGRSVALALYTAFALAVSLELPIRAHAEFPPGYASGFPAAHAHDPVAAAYLDPARAWLYRLPGLREAAYRHRALVRTLARHYAGLRREEHHQFLVGVAPEGRALRRLVEQGLLPPDTQLAICCVGAIPYYSRLPVLDRLGLTDAEVARGPVVQPDLLAHAKSADRAYARARGVDIWSVDPVHVLFAARNPALAEGLRGLHASGADAWFARAGPGHYLVAELLQGETHARRKFAALRWHSVRDRAAVQQALREMASVRAAAASGRRAEPRPRP